MSWKDTNSWIAHTAGNQVKTLNCWMLRQRQVDNILGPTTGICIAAQLQRLPPDQAAYARRASPAPPNRHTSEHTA